LKEAGSYLLDRRFSMFPRLSGQNQRYGRVAENSGAAENPQMSDPNHSLRGAGLVRQALEEHGVRLFPRFDIIEIVKNNLFDPLIGFQCKGVSNGD